MGRIKSNPHFMKGPIGKVVTILAILVVPNFQYVNKHHLIDSIRKHPCARLATDTWHP